jgi:hypothetical protein
LEFGSEKRVNRTKTISIFQKKRLLFELQPTPAWPGSEEQSIGGMSLRPPVCWSNGKVGTLIAKRPFAAAPQRVRIDNATYLCERQP